MRKRGCTIHRLREIARLLLRLHDLVCDCTTALAIARLRLRLHDRVGVAMARMCGGSEGVLVDARQHTRKRIKQLDKDTALWTIGDAHGGEIYYTAGQRKDGPPTAPPHRHHAST